MKSDAASMTSQIRAASPFYSHTGDNCAGIINLAREKKKVANVPKTVNISKLFLTNFVRPFLLLESQMISGV